MLLLLRLLQLLRGVLRACATRIRIRGTSRRCRSRAQEYMESAESSESQQNEHKQRTSRPGHWQLLQLARPKVRPALIYDSIGEPKTHFSSFHSPFSSTSIRVIGCTSQAVPRHAPVFPT